MMYLSGVLGIALIALGALYKAEYAENAVLNVQVSGLTAAYESIENNHKAQEEILVEREGERQDLLGRVNQLKSDINKESEDDAEIKAYMDTVIPDSIYERLQQPITIGDSGEGETTNGATTRTLSTDSIWPDEQAFNELRDRFESQSGGLLEGQGKNKEVGSQG